MKKFAIAVIIIIVGFCLHSALQNRLSPNVKQMISYAKNFKGGDASRMFNNFTKSEYRQLENYFDRNPGDIPPLYMMALADHVFEHDKEKAVFFYFFGRLRSTEDVYMCQDKTARQQIYVYPNWAPNTLKYANEKFKDKKYQVELLEKVIKYDEKHKERISPIWSCYHGMSAFFGEPKLLPEYKFEEIRKEVLEPSLKRIREYRSQN